MTDTTYDIAGYLRRQTRESQTDKWVELSIVKEFLLAEQKSLANTLNAVESESMSEFYKELVSEAIRKKKRVIDNLLNRVLSEIQTENSKNNS